jgi:hypothetical protein
MGAMDLSSAILRLEATTGFEPVIRVLQTLALPLGHVAMRDYSIVTDDGIRAVHKTHIS